MWLNLKNLKSIIKLKISKIDLETRSVVITGEEISLRLSYLVASKAKFDYEQLWTGIQAGREWATILCDSIDYESDSTFIKLGDFRVDTNRIMPIDPIRAGDNLKKEAGVSDTGRQDLE